MTTNTTTDSCRAIREAADKAVADEQAALVENANQSIRALFHDELAPAVIATRDKDGCYWVCGRPLRASPTHVWGEAPGVNRSVYWISSMSDLSRYLKAWDEYEALPLPPEPPALPFPPVTYVDESVRPSFGFLAWLKRLFS